MIRIATPCPLHPMCDVFLVFEKTNRRPVMKPPVVLQAVVPPYVDLSGYDFISEEHTNPYLPPTVTATSPVNNKKRWWQREQPNR